MTETRRTRRIHFWRRPGKRLIFGLALAAALVLAAGCGGGKEERADGNAVVGAEPERIPERERHTSIRETEKEKTGGEDSGRSGEQPGEETVRPERQLTEPETEQVVTEKDEPPAGGGNRMQIVFLGDSILDSHRDGTGIAYLTGLQCDADVYNLSMGGTTAALLSDEKAEYENWTSRCLVGVTNVICGNVSPGILNGYRAGEAYETVDFDRTDYFVIEYGMNDFFAAVPLNDNEKPLDIRTYAGALRVAVTNLRDRFPDAAIVLCSPNYAQFFSEDKFLGDGNVVDNGGGKLVEYYRVCGNVSYDMNTLFLNAYEGIGLDTYTAGEYLEDGIHLSEKGRKAYAEALSSLILDYEATKNN